MTTTALKLVALVLMLLDHVGEFIPGMPVWLRWLGRLSAPLFVLCSAWGFSYTRNRKRYLLNLYAWGVGMAVGSYVLVQLVPVGTMLPLNNIFVTLLLSWVLVQIVEDYRTNHAKRATLLLCGLLVVQAVGLQLVSGILISTANTPLAVLVASLLPSVLFCEGGVLFVALGVGLYFARRNKKLLTLTYLAFCILFLVSGLSEGRSVQHLLFVNYQWMMVGSLPLMLCYNGQKGRGLKWFFYAFYPAHIYLLYWLGSLML